MVREAKNTCLQWYQEMKNRPVRTAVALVFGLSLWLLTWIIAGPGEGARHNLICAALCLGSGVLLALPKWGNKLSVLALVVYAVYVPLKIFQRIELPFHDMSLIAEKVTGLSVWLILCLYLLLFIVTQSTGLALGIGNIVLIFLFLSEYFVCEFRGTIITPNDLSALGTAAMVVGNYQFRLSAEAWYTVLYLIAFTVFGFHIRIRGGRAYHILGSAAALLAVGGFYYTVFSSSYLETWNISGYYWNPVNNQEINGTFLSFFIMYKESKMEVPGNYSVQRAEEIAADAEEAYGEQSGTLQPDIIMIMNEAWSDLAVLGALETSEDYMPFTHSLAEDTIQGNLHVSVRGGLTANTEFEALTGASLSLLAPTTIPYGNQLNHDIYALPRILKAQGYATLAMHPSMESAWSRDEAYVYMGFDDFIGADDFATSYTYVRSFISDACNFQEIIYRYENRDTEQPFFLFDVTIQNHSSYAGEIDLPIEVESVNGVLAEEISDTYDLQTYLNLIAVTDEAFAELIGYFSGVETPVIVCMFGDHQPWLEEVFYETMFQGRALSELEQNMLTYITPYVIWSNYDLAATEYGDISANYLPAVLLEAAGMELPAYYQFLLNTMEEYPVLSIPVCIDSEGNLSTYADISGQGSIADYQILQYNLMYDREASRDIFLPRE